MPPNDYFLNSVKKKKKKKVWTYTYVYEIHTYI